MSKLPKILKDTYSKLYYVELAERDEEDKSIIPLDIYTESRICKKIGNKLVDINDGKIFYVDGYKKYATLCEPLINYYDGKEKIVNSYESKTVHEKIEVYKKSIRECVLETIMEKLLKRSYDDIFYINYFIPTEFSRTYAMGINESHLCTRYNDFMFKDVTNNSEYSTKRDYSYMGECYVESYIPLSAYYKVTGARKKIDNHDSFWVNELYKKYKDEVNKAAKLQYKKKHKINIK